MEAPVSGPKLVQVSLGGPAFGAPVRLGQAGDKVDFVPPRSHVINDNMAVRAPPLRAIVDGESVQQRSQEGGAVGNTASEAGLLRAEEPFPHARMHTIGTDQRI